MIRLKVGDRAKLLHGSRADAIRWWTTQAADDRFAVLTRQADFKPKGKIMYTILDYEREVRGPCNLIFGFDVEAPDGPDNLLRSLNVHINNMNRLAQGETFFPVTEMSCEVSYRNNVPIEYEAVDIR